MMSRGDPQGIVTTRNGDKVQHQGDSSGPPRRGAQTGALLGSVVGNVPLAAVVVGERDGAAERGSECRDVVDAEGVRWRVYELARPAGPASRAGRGLVFDSDAVVRRVSSYPKEWRDLPPADLLALSRGR
jgi:hypothetical protein